MCGPSLLVAALGSCLLGASSDEEPVHAAVLADAAGRTSLYRDELLDGEAAFTSGPGGSTLDISGQVQTRYTMNFADVSSPREDFSNGFEMTRVRVFFTGSVNEVISYRVEAGSDFGSDFVLNDAYAVFSLGERTAILVGQFRVPSVAEEIVRSWHQLAADRSVLSRVFATERTQGIALLHTREDVKVILGFDDGAGTANTPFLSASEADYGLTGRFDWKLIGDDWTRFEDFTSFRGSDLAAKVGGLVHWQAGGETGAIGGTTADVDVFQTAGDVWLEGNGWNVLGEVIYRRIDPGGGSSRDDYGFLVQGGAFITEQTELFGRFDIVIPDNGASADEPFSTVTVGANYYLIPESHAAKFTVDFQWFVDGTGETDIVDPAGNPLLTQVGLVGSEEDVSYAVRFQFQLLF